MTPDLRLRTSLTPMIADFVREVSGKFVCSEKGVSFVLRVEDFSVEQLLLRTDSCEQR